MRVLYVEDDATTAKAVELMLHKEGFAYDTVALGEQAVELGKRNEYDLILLDIMLPDIDGYDVIGRLRAAGVYTPVLVQTGLADTEMQLNGLGYGTGEYLVKPFNKTQLVEHIGAVVSGVQNNSISDPVYRSDRLATLHEYRPERRAHRRFRSMKAGEMTHKDARSPIRCVVLNLSQGGAALKLLGDTSDCLPAFALKLKTGPIHHCEVCWRFQDKIGVKFLDLKSPSPL